MGSEFERLTRNSHTIVVSSESASAAERRTSDPSGVLVIIFHGRRHQKSRPRARARSLSRESAALEMEEEGRKEGRK